MNSLWKLSVSSRSKRPHPGKEVHSLVPPGPLAPGPKSPWGSVLVSVLAPGPGKERALGRPLSPADPGVSATLKTGPCVALPSFK